MKFFRDLLIIAVAAMIFGCSNDNNSSNSNLGPTPAPINPNAITNAGQPQGGAGAAAPTGVQHYICPNNCANSGSSSAGTCPVCGTQYQHNQAWHTQQNAGANNPALNNPAQQQPSPAQNAAGVYHYTCPNGHEGGAGIAQPCTVCGITLVHNQAYHATGTNATATPSNPATVNPGAKSPLYINNN